MVFRKWALVKQESQHAVVINKALHESYLSGTISDSFKCNLTLSCNKVSLRKEMSFPMNSRLTAGPALYMAPLLETCWLCLQLESPALSDCSAGQRLEHGSSCEHWATFWQHRGGCCGRAAVAARAAPCHFALLLVGLRLHY